MDTQTELARIDAAIKSLEEYMDAHNPDDMAPNRVNAVLKRMAELWARRDELTGADADNTKQEN